MSILSQARELHPELKALKDDLHRHPELSFQERRTTAVLLEKLAPLDLEIVDLGMETGVVALLTEDRTATPDAAQLKAVNVAAAFLARQMEE